MDSAPYQPQAFEAQSYQPESYRPLSDLKEKLRSRGTSFLLAVLLEILIVIGLITLSPSMTSKPKLPDETKTFRFAPSVQPKPQSKAAAKAAAHAKSTNPRPVIAPPIPPVKSPVPTPVKSTMLNDRDLFDLADISKMHGAGEKGDGKSGATYGPGEGPGGEQLYEAEWYREPTSAEINGYLPADAPHDGYALIACRTIADYHVENCRTLEESPVGSGLARDMRLAAWQFRVRPKRLGGKVLVGSWVKILIEFHEGTVSTR